MDRKKNDGWIYWAVFSVPVIWLALLTAPCLGGNIFEVMEKLETAVKTPFRITWCNNTIRSVAFFLAVYGFCGVIWYSTKQNLREGEEHGSAKWGNAREVSKALAPTGGIPLTKHVSLGMDTHKHRRNLNILVIGGSGAGKTRFLATPSIISAPLLGNSLVITDPKGEILYNTGKLLKDSGYEVKVLNLVDFDQSDSYNPFRYIRDDKDVLKLITNLIQNTNPKGSGSSDPFWEKSETALLEALMFYLLYEAPEEDQNFGMIMTMLQYADVSENDDNHKSALDLLFEQLALNHPDHIAVRQYSIYKTAAGKTAKSIIVSLAVRLSAFNLDQVRSITSVDTMDFRSLGEKKTAVFAVIPDNDTSLSFIVGMLYTQIIQELYYQADHVHHGALPVHVRLILDEFANVSLPSSFDRSLATMRSREISSTIIIQNLAQLKALYKDNGWETICGNCDTLVYLGGNEQSTHEYISKLLGKETITTKSHGESKGKSGSYSTNTQTSGRELMTPDEVRMLDNSNALLFIRGFPAVMDEKYDLTKHVNYCKTANGGYPPYIHREPYFTYTPFGKAFDFTAAEDYELIEEEEE